MRAFLAAILLAAGAARAQPPAASADIVIYGGHAAAILAAVQAGNMGRSVLIAAPEQHLGGMSVEGLGGSDINNHWFRNDLAVGGLAAEFYRRVGARYGSSRPVYRFEPHAAEAVFEDLIREHRIRVFRRHRLREPLASAVEWEAGTRRLRAIRCENGARFEGRYFLDATIEGDLLAAAGVETVVGREANSKYGETKNGIRGENTYRQFPFRLDPYWESGNPARGLLPPGCSWCTRPTWPPWRQARASERRTRSANGARGGSSPPSSASIRSAQAWSSSPSRSDHAPVVTSVTEGGRSSRR